MEPRLRPRLDDLRDEHEKRFNRWMKGIFIAAGVVGAIGLGLLIWFMVLLTRAVDLIGQ